MSETNEQAVVFQPLADYRMPSMPTLDAIQLGWIRLRELFRRQPDAPMITDDRLRRSTLKMLDEVVAPPACGPLVDELQQTLADWVADTEPLMRNRLVVLPPGDRNGVLRAWGEQYGHHVLEAPPRDEIIDGRAEDIEEPGGDGVLVVPALEQWFVRHRNGLTLIRALLARLDGLDRHVVVGCNSWAWQFLVRAVQADAIFGPPLIFQPFDGPRLRAWFSAMSESETLDPVRFLDSRTGEDILAADDSDDSAHKVLVTLAARSLGIPWVAWRLWRRSLRRRVEIDGDGDGDGEQNDTGDTPSAATIEADEEQTLWVIALEEYSLPGNNGKQDNLLILQALLIHGSLTPAQLSAVLPIVGESNRLSTLIASGLVERYNDRVGCAPTAYSAIRSGLTTAGFPIAEI